MIAIDETINQSYYEVNVSNYRQLYSIYHTVSLPFKDPDTKQ